MTDLKAHNAAKPRRKNKHLMALQVLINLFSVSCGHFFDNTGDRAEGATMVKRLNIRSDIYCEKDLLGFDKYVETLSSMIEDSDFKTPFCIARD